MGKGRGSRNDPGNTAEPAIARAWRLIAEHPAVIAVESPITDTATGMTAMAVRLSLGLPNAWKADGASPNGVRAEETANFYFPPQYPLRAPVIRLRPDFDRSLAHVQPGATDTPPVPCIYDGTLSELLQQRGLGAVIDQLVLWLENAALGRLIDPKQGWEPVRRDSLDDLIVADATALRALVTRDTGHVVFGFEYARWQPKNGLGFIFGEIGPDTLKFNRDTIGDLLAERPLKGTRSVIGRSLAVFAWPGKHPSGAPVIADRYKPETVVDFGTLKARAAEYGCDTVLMEAVSRIETCLAGYNCTDPHPIAVILCARRPFHLIGSDSDLELCPYIVEITAPRLLSKGDSTPVRPAGHRHAIAAPLLRRMAGYDAASQPPWVQLGGGSLGSKIALHLARSGNAPSVVIDRANLSPHNAARHALVPPVGMMQVSWLQSKAMAIAAAIEGLGQSARHFHDDIIDLLRDPEKVKQALPRKAVALVNSTASIVAREALASAAASLPRVIETTLYARGAVGYLSVEGLGRNPDTGDLASEAYALAREDLTLRSLVFGIAGTERHQIGEGCGSATTAMSDARISAFAAPMAEAIGTMLQDELPRAGRIAFGVIGPDSMSLHWTHHDVEPFAVAVMEGSTWHVHVSPRAHRKIVEDVARWPSVETGGVIVGRLSEAARTCYVVDVLAAPEDSTRSACEFVLGTSGVRLAIDAYSESSGRSLYCLGTWHSHLAASGPSPKDRATAATLALARTAPSVLLIHTPEGYRALLADASAGGLAGLPTLAATEAQARRSADR